MIIKSKLGKTIRSVDDWEAYAPPASKKLHWVDGRSAKELAKLWIKNGSDQLPEVLTQLFCDVVELRHVEINLVVPECKTKLDHYGNGRVHDLLLYGKSGKEKIVISIEAKVDEPFGPTIKERKKDRRAHSNIDKRIARLAESLFYQKDIEHVRYQLLHGIAGTLIEAKRHKATYAVFVVHEFFSHLLDSSKNLKNNQDLDEFVSCLTNKPTSLDHGTLLGPFYVPGGEDISKDIPIYIGKIKTNCSDVTEKKFRKRAIKV